MADGGFGRSWGSGYRARARERGEGKRRGAHGDHAEQHSGVGEDLVTANRRRRKAEPEEEDGGDSGDGARPEVRGLTRRERGSRRSWEASQGGEGRPVATVMPVGGGGGSRVRGRESRGRRGGRGRVRAVRGSCVASSGASRAREGSRRWPAGGEVARARAGERRAHAVPLSGRKTTEEGPGGLGRLLAGPACCCWAAQGRGGPGKPLLLLFLFSNFSDICFDLIKILNQFIFLCQFL